MYMPYETCPTQNYKSHGVNNDQPIQKEAMSISPVEHPLHATWRKYYELVCVKYLNKSVKI